MQGARIKFRVDAQGQVHIDVDGVEGQSCAELTAAFEKALGIKVEVQEKPEYFCELEGHEAHIYEGEE